MVFFRNQEPILNRSSTPKTMIAITGASGQLGRLTLDQLLAAATPASSIAALVRQPAKASDLAARGMHLRTADYNKPNFSMPRSTASRSCY